MCYPNEQLSSLVAFGLSFNLSPVLAPGGEQGLAMTGGPKKHLANGLKIQILGPTLKSDFLGGMWKSVSFKAPQGILMCPKI